MWWRLANGGSINSTRVDRVAIAADGQVYTLVAWQSDLGYQLAGTYDSEEAAQERAVRLTNALDPSSL